MIIYQLQIILSDKNKKASFKFGVYMQNLSVSIYSGSKENFQSEDQKKIFEESILDIFKEFIYTEKIVHFYTGGFDMGIMHLVGKKLIDLKKIKNNVKICSIKPTQWMNDKDDLSDEVIEVSSIQMRKERLSNSDFIIVFPGGIGTFDEIMDTLATQEKNVIIFDPFDLFSIFKNLITHSVQAGYTSEKTLEKLHVFSDPLHMKMFIRAEMNVFNKKNKLNFL